ncbi:sensor histidine kinase [Haloplasma contractile]|uniref:histidine kinase n=1 Tax=Haloplasma contractile SSD-17B TaxID=1033810 RepID=U2DS42_9MOLU|nr:histidine kinase [Haloplasma contractile]ERJ11372.1 two-component system NarL family sensor histidine kinase DesK protein [Haloplasma contractile SSD-17B]
MGNILNKLLILLGAIVILLFEFTPYQAVIALMVAVAISGLLDYFNNEKVVKALFTTYLILSGFYPQFVFFLPLISYDLFKSKSQLLTLIAIIPFALHFNEFSLGTIGGLIVIYLMVYLLKLRAMNESKLREDYINQRDYLTELSISLEKKNNELIINQDVEVHLATLNERNRIAREIHDNVGHLLSSSILQIGAIIAVSKEEDTVKSLEVVKNTLNEGMNSIRNSVHDLHEESIDLYAEIKKIIRNFAFCKVKLNYDIYGELPAKTKYAIIAIIKEALSNVIKHSDGDYVSITLYEHPKLFQLVIYDNGKKKKNIENSKGMGLESIKQRVTLLNGIININQSKGFKLFISFMKS